MNESHVAVELDMPLLTASSHCIQPPPQANLKLLAEAPHLSPSLTTYILARP